MKIHDSTEDINKQKKKHIVTIGKHQDIESKYHTYETLSDVINNNYKGFAGSTFTVRTSKELDTSLRVYSETNNIPIAESIKTILEKYFKDRYVSRTFFKLDKSFTVAIPLSPHELAMYIEDEINCIIDFSSDINSRLEVQRHIIKKDETNNYLAVTFNVGNNYLDTYHEDAECYFAGTLTDHHIGLYDIYLEHLKESVFLQVMFHERNPISARLITIDKAIQYAITVKNEMLEKYLKNIEQTNTILDYKESLIAKNNYIKTLEARIKSLESEISNLKDDETNDDDVKSDQDDEIDDVIDTESLADITQLIITQKKVEEQLQEQIKPIMNVLFNLEMQKRDMNRFIASIMSIPKNDNESKTDDADDDT